MGCRCCKMIQSYLFDPVQVPSPGFVNEVSGCKLEEDTARLKGPQSIEVETSRNVLRGGSLTRTDSKARAAGLARPEPPPQEDSGGGPCMEKCGVTINGISPPATLQLVRSPGSRQGCSVSWDHAHPAQPFLEGTDSGKQSPTLSVPEGTQVLAPADHTTAPAADSLVLAADDRILQIPAPDYPQLWDPEVDGMDLEEKDCLFQNLPEDDPLRRIHPRVGEPALNMPFPTVRSWDSLNEARATEDLSGYFKEEGPLRARPVVDPGNEPEDSHAFSGEGLGNAVDEDAEVAEALAALEAATAGEDVDEAD